MEGDGFVQFKAMIMTTSMHLMLLVFDILACDNLDNDNHSWMFVFIPLMFMSIVSIGFCVWAIKNERSFEVMHQSFVAPAPLGPRNSGAFNFSIFKALLKALHCRAKFVINPR